MQTTGADGSALGGGEILQYWGKNPSLEANYPLMDNALIKQFAMMPYFKLVITVLILAIMAILLLKLLNIRSFLKSKGMTRELERMERLRKRDQSIMRANRTMAWITNMVESTPFRMSNISKEYWQYNLNRAGVRIPGGARVIKAVEFHSLIIFITWWLLVIEALVFIFVNSVVGVVLAVATVVFSSTLPMIMLRGTVKAKDDEIKANFSDYYLMMHYVLIAGANTPLNSVMKSYAKTTSSVEMQRYIDSCLHYIDTYGEYESTRFIAKDYREIPEVGKLMRLIRQANEGGEIASELMGFRMELLKTKQFEIEKRMNKLVAKAQASFNLLTIILVQAVLSAMSIYITDMGLITTFI